jgi:hypothetical protein
MTSRTLILGLAALFGVSAAPPPEGGRESTTQAERRLRACLVTHSGGQATLEAALLAARSACKSQIESLLDIRIIHATAGLEYGAARVVERRVTGALNQEIALAVANFTRLPATNAQNR